jgi:hypothetical protein
LRTRAGSSIITALRIGKSILAPRQAGLVIRQLAKDDLASALTLQAASYPAALREGTEAFASRLDVPASYCLAALRDGMLVAYLLAHGWTAGAPPPVRNNPGGGCTGEGRIIH